MRFLRYLAVCLGLLVLTSCSAPSASAETGNPCSTEVLAMDTVMKLTVYNQPAERGLDILRRAVSKIEELDALLSVTNEGSEIYRANHSQGSPSVLTEAAEDLLTEALSLCDATGGALDVTIYPVVRAWGFTTGEYRVPEEAELRELLPEVDYTRVSLADGSLTLPEGMELDLGAVAKGYTGDQLMAFFAGEGVTSAIVELGGNVQALGSKPDGSPWRVALQAPEGGYAAVLEIVDQAVITSGGYQRYFEQNGKTYIHIINPDTGYPAETGLDSVTIVAGSGTVGDGLSTALFVMGRDDAENYWRAHQDFDFILLTDEGGVVITEGIEDAFSLYGDWVGRPVEVIRK